MPAKRRKDTHIVSKDAREEPTSKRRRRAAPEAAAQPAGLQEVEDVYKVRSVRLLQCYNTIWRP